MQILLYADIITYGHMVDVLSQEMGKGAREITVYEECCTCERSGGR